MEPFYRDDAVTLYQARAEAVLPTLPAASVDLIVTDPPYFRVKGEWWDRQWDSRDGFLRWLGSLAVEWRRVLRPNGSLYVFASPELAWHVEGVVRERFNVLNSVRWVKEDGWHQKTEKEELRSFLSPWEAVIFAEHVVDEYADADRLLHIEIYGRVGAYLAAERQRAGLTCNDVDLALGFAEKRRPDRGSRLSYRWETGACLPSREDYERLRTLLQARVPDALARPYDDVVSEFRSLDTKYLERRRSIEAMRRPFALSDRAEWSDVWRFKTVQARYGKHPCEKPLALAEHIIRSSSRPGAVILDCFAGSGAFLTAARNLGRVAIGVEVEERHCRSIVARLSQALLPLDIAS